MSTVEAALLYKHTCAKCGHIWLTLKARSRQCPKCWCRQWDKPKDGEKPASQ